MANNMFQEDDKVIVVNTGNILSLNDITKNPGQNPAEELAEAISLTVSNVKANKCDSNNGITCTEGDMISNASEEELQNLKIGIKVFLNEDKANFLDDALEKAFTALKVSSVHNVIISLNHKGNAAEQVEKIKNIWKTIEHFVGNGKIQQVGLSDIEEGAFRQVYDFAKTKPSIIQINLATCCVVPPTLQQFCKDNDVLLLTHSDPADILPTASISQIFGAPFSLNWALRFLVHIKCRGVLTTKGYILSLTK